jgi:hypothetical protein
MDPITALALGAAGKVAYDIAGPVIRDLGEMLKEELAPYRAARGKRLLEKMAKMVKEGDITVHRVPGRILFPIVESASLEDDENLHSKWAALLVNAANSEVEMAVLKRWASMYCGRSGTASFMPLTSPR